MNNTEVTNLLANVTLGSLLFVSYIPGRTPKPQAHIEGRRAVVNEGISPRHFTGTLSNVSKNKRGETVFTLWVNERDSLQSDGTLTHGAYRAFNASLGTLQVITVLQEAPVPTTV